MFNFLSITIVPDQKINTLAIKSNTGMNGFVAYVVEPYVVWVSGGIADERILHNPANAPTPRAINAISQPALKSKRHFATAISR